MPRTPRERAVHRHEHACRRTDGYHRAVPADPSTSEALGSAFAAGHAELRAVYDAHGKLVYSLCRRALGADAARDVTQEVFISAWKGRAQFDPERGNLAQWLVGITKRRIVDHLRAEGRHVVRRADEDDGRIHAHSEPYVERLGDKILVADAMEQLPDRRRTVIHMAYLDDLTHQQIAEQTGLPLGTVKSDIRRGLERIRQHLEPRHA